jgi:AraC-like DNA-binding protein
VRSREPRLTVRALLPLMSGLTTLGFDSRPFLQTGGIGREMLLDPDATVPMSACVGLLADAVRETGDDTLGLHVAERAELGSFDVHFYAMVSSPTLGAAFEHLCRYQRLIHETSQVRLEKSRNRAVLSHRLAGGMAAPRRARAALSRELPAGNMTAQGVAARLSVSLRTLHRTLAAEGTSYRRLLDQLRLDIAERHLTDDRMSVAEIAFLVGFSEISAFHRAFKRWTGRTPVTFRAEARVRPPGRSRHA